MKIQIDVKISFPNMMEMLLQNRYPFNKIKILSTFKIITFSKIKSIIFHKWQMNLVLSLLTVILAFLKKKTNK
jgi:hypothetical protein